MKLGKVIDKKLEKKKLEADEKPDLQIAKLGNFKYISTEKGVELLKQLQDMFDIMDGWEKEKQEYQRIIVERKGEEKRVEDRRDGEKVKFSVPIDFIDHKEYITYETTGRGLDHFKHLMDPHKEKRELVLLEELIEEIPNLTFYDGVTLTWEIVKRIIDECFDDDVKDKYGYSYKDWLLAEVDDVLTGDIFTSIRKNRAEYLHKLFVIGSSAYTRPA